MPVAPPPPPPLPPGCPPAPPPPPPPFSAGGAQPPKLRAEDSKGRGALLADIHKGARLKKVVQANDRSAPQIDGSKAATKEVGGTGNTRNGGPASANGAGSGSAPQLGGLFAGGFPALKPAGNRDGTVGKTAIQTGRARTPTPKFPDPVVVNANEGVGSVLIPPDTTRHATPPEPPSITSRSVPPRPSIPAPPLPPPQTNAGKLSMASQPPPPPPLFLERPMQVISQAPVAPPPPQPGAPPFLPPPLPPQMERPAKFPTTPSHPPPPPPPGSHNPSYLNSGRATPPSLGPPPPLPDFRDYPPSGPPPLPPPYSGRKLSSPCLPTPNFAGQIESNTPPYPPRPRSPKPGTQTATGSTTAYQRSPAKPTVPSSGRLNPPPLPPARSPSTELSSRYQNNQNQTRTTSRHSYYDDFESKFTFHSADEFPAPEEFRPSKRMYPSRDPSASRRDVPMRMQVR
ncbi:WAS/WASL-interacting protein family member 3 isoform X2 [Ambystoma mexicanum]|uniref:WAS/WASL-interacting protein family member 3 isoform X2 n=1 Tax=Ambystoma mexicanum TaxID=8296 RepID=UPI0037E7261C